MPKWYPVGASFPRAPARSQFDDPTPDKGDNKDGNNCTMALLSRLLRFVTDRIVLPGALRNLQSDQEGGTDLDDANMAWQKVTGYPLERGKVTWDGFLELLRMGYMVIIQFDYGELPEVLRIQKTFVDGHASVVDGYRENDDGTVDIWMLDTIARGAGYRGKYYPAHIIRRACGAIAGDGFVLCAWAARNPPVATITQVEKYPANTVVGITAGTTVRAFNPRINRPTKTTTHTKPGPIPVDSLVTIIQFPDANRQPHGTFYHATGGMYAGLYIPKGIVGLTLRVPEQPASTPEAVAKARLEGLTAGIQKGEAEGFNEGLEAAASLLQGVPRRVVPA